MIHQKFFSGRNSSSQAKVSSKKSSHALLSNLTKPPLKLMGANDFLLSDLIFLDPFDKILRIKRSRPNGRLKMSFLFKTLIVFALAPHLAFSSENINQITCTHFKESERWAAGISSSFAESFDLAAGEIQFVGALWTTSNPSEANGICTLIRGMKEPDMVEIENYIYTGERIGAVAETDCYAIGDKIQLVKKIVKILNRGEFLQSELAWEPPETPLLKYTIYIPTLSELEDISATLQTKCQELE